MLLEEVKTTCSPHLAAEIDRFERALIREYGVYNTSLWVAGRLIATVRVVNATLTPIGSVVLAEGKLHRVTGPLDDFEEIKQVETKSVTIASVDSLGFTTNFSDHVLTSRLHEALSWLINGTEIQIYLVNNVWRLF